MHRPSLIPFSALASAALLAGAVAVGPASARAAKAPAAPTACTDFYAFANAGWLAANPLPVGQQTSGRLAQMQAAADASERALMAAVAAAPANDAETLLGRFWSSGLDVAGLDAGSAAAVEAVLKPIAQLRRARDLPKVSAAFHQLGLSPLVEFVRLGDGGSELAAVPVPLGLRDPAFYTRAEPEVQQLLGRYRAYVERVLRASGLAEAEISPASEAVLQIETRLAQAMGAAPADERQNDALRAQDRRYAALGLSQTLERLGGKVESLVVLNPAYFATLAAVAASETPQRLQWYLRFNVLHRLAPDLGAPFRDAHGDFFAKQLNDQAAAPSREQHVGELLRRQLPGLLDTVANARLVDAALRQRAEGVLQGVQKAAANRDAAFAEVSIDLAGSLQPGFAAEGLSFEAGDHVGNLLRLWRWRNQRTLDGETTPVAAFPALRPIVQFDAGRRTLTVTAAALQPPLLGASAGAADFGALGALSGHELSKAVDAGSRGAALQATYAVFEALPGQRVDGFRTLAMNRADVAGLEFAWDAFMTAQPQADVAAKQAFFAAWAALWAEYASPEASRLQAQTSPFAPPRWRVNGPLAQLPAFAETYGCRAGQPMRAASPVSVWR